MRKSKIYNFSVEELKQVIKKSDSVKQLFESISMKDVGGNRQTLYRIISEYELDIEFEALKERAKSLRIEKLNKESLFKEIPFEEVFIENSSLDRKNVKNKILKYNLIEYKCRKCGNTGEWMGEPLVLHLEHKNGISNDNRLENLEFLCPSCHSQTPTYAGRNIAT